MEFSTDIKFSCNLIKNKNTTITYSGYLYKNNSESVTMVYGFGDNWEKTTEQQMEKTDKGFVTRINLLNFDKINFCFRNSNYVWDNNNNQNYGCLIKDAAPVVTRPAHSENTMDDAFVINENVIGGILTNLFENNITNLQNIKPQEQKIVSKVKNVQPTTNQVESQTQNIDAYTFGAQTVKNQVVVPEVKNIKIEPETSTVQAVEAKVNNTIVEDIKPTINAEIQSAQQLEDDIEIEDIVVEGEVAEGIKIENIFDTMFIEPITNATLNSYNSEVTPPTKNITPQDKGTSEIDKIIESFKTPVETKTETVKDAPSIVDEVIKDYESPVKTEVAAQDIKNNTQIPDENSADTYEALLKAIKEDYASRYGSDTEETTEKYYTESTIDTPAQTAEVAPVANGKTLETIADEVKTATAQETTETYYTESTIDTPIENVETTPVVEEKDDSFYVDIEKNEAVNIEDTMVTATIANKLNKQIERSFDDIYLGEDYTETETETVEEPKKEVSKFDMDGLINEILSPVIKSSNFADNFNRITVEEPETVTTYENIETKNYTELDKTTNENKFEELQDNTEASLIEEALNSTNNIETQVVNETEKETETTTALTTVNEDSYMVSARSLGTFYKIRKKIKLAFYKIFGILPRLLFDYDEEN